MNRVTPTLIQALAVALAALLGGCGPASSPPPPPPVPPATQSPAAAASAAAQPDYRRLLGRWVRQDGGYVLHLRQVDPASGKLDAAYLNPQPIHVAQAEARQEGGKTTVFVELQDVNYPGCTYRLNYFPATDQLYGTYFQAALQQSYDVEFERER